MGGIRNVYTLLAKTKEEKRPLGIFRGSLR
jgi:hypothetical protein